MGKNLKAGISSNLGEKLGEKRDRRSGDETDTDSVASGSYDGLRIKNSKRKKVGEKTEKGTDNPSVQIEESGEEDERNEKGTEGDVYDEIRELERLLRKTRNSTREVKNYTLEKSEIFRANVVKHASQAGIDNWRWQ